METIGKRIEELRYKNNLTLDDLSKYLGISKTAVRKYETGATKNIKYENVEKLAQLFNVSIDYLLNGTKEETEEDKFIKLLIQKTLDKKLEWVEVNNKIKYNFNDEILDANEILDMLDFVIPPSRRLNVDYKVKVTSINNNIIFFMHERHDILQTLIYGTKNYLNVIENGEYENPLMEQLDILLFNPVIYIKKLKLNTLIEDLENL